MTPAYVAEDIKTVYNLSLRFVQCNLQAFAYTLLSVFSPRGSSIYTNGKIFNEGPCESTLRVAPNQPLALLRSKYFSDALNLYNQF